MLCLSAMLQLPLQRALVSFVVQTTVMLSCGRLNWEELAQGLWERETHGVVLMQQLLWGALLRSVPSSPS